MLAITERVIGIIYGLMNKTEMPKMVLEKTKSWGYIKNGAKIYFFSNDGALLTAIFKGNNVSLEYSTVRIDTYNKLSYMFTDGKLVKSDRFGTVGRGSK